MNPSSGGRLSDSDPNAGGNPPSSGAGSLHSDGGEGVPDAPLISPSGSNVLAPSARALLPETRRQTMFDAPPISPLVGIPMATSGRRFENYFARPSGGGGGGLGGPAAVLSPAVGQMIPHEVSERIRLLQEKVNKLEMEKLELQNTPELDTMGFSSGLLPRPQAAIPASENIIPYFPSPMRRIHVVKAIEDFRKQHKSVTEELYLTYQLPNIHKPNMGIVATRLIYISFRIKALITVLRQLYLYDALCAIISAPSMLDGTSTDIENLSTIIFNVIIKLMSNDPGNAKLRDILSQSANLPRLLESMDDRWGRIENGKSLIVFRQKILENSLVDKDSLLAYVERLGMEASLFNNVIEKINPTQHISKIHDQELIIHACKYLSPEISSLLQPRLDPSNTHYIDSYVKFQAAVETLGPEAALARKNNQDAIDVAIERKLRERDAPGTRDRGTNNDYTNAFVAHGENRSRPFACYHCGDPNHHIRDCPTLPAHLRRPNNGGNRGGHSGGRGGYSRQPFQTPPGPRCNWEGCGSNDHDVRTCPLAMAHFTLLPRTGPSSNSSIILPGSSGNISRAPDSSGHNARMATEMTQPAPMSGEKETATFTIGGHRAYLAITNSSEYVVTLDSTNQVIVASTL